MEIPTITNKYQQGKIYKIVSNNTHMIYIGSTTSPLSMRMAQHRSNFLRCRSGYGNHVSAYDILDIDMDAQIFLVEEYPCYTVEALRARERYHIELNRDICVNMVIPGRTHKEYYEENRDKILRKHKQRYKDKKEKIAQYNK